jgi:hypothetical protein
MNILRPAREEIGTPKTVARFWTKPRQTCLFPILTLLVSLLARPRSEAATWYVDPQATGTKNGASWANAWTSLSSASGSSVMAGDTVYISGGSTSQTYSGTWSPKNGSSGGGRITYQIGQEAGHNGTAIFSTSGTWLGALSYVNIVGDANDGLQHFKVSGINQAQAGNADHVRIAYVNLGTNNAATYFWNFGTAGFLEVDHCFWYITGSTCAKGFLVNNFSGTTWDQSIIHDNVGYTPHGSDPVIGCDGSACGSTSANTGGYTFSNNLFISYQGTANGTEHCDGWQCSGGSYIKLVNNVITGFGDIGIYGGGLWAVNSFSHVRYFNNIVDSVGHNAAGCIVVESDNGFSGTMTDIQIFNNIARSDSTSADAIWFVPHDSGVTCSGNYWSNNIAICGIGGYSYVSGKITGGNNLTFNSDSAVAKFFVSFVAGRITNDWHLAAGASALIGKGGNLYSAFMYDKDGNARPSTGAWDIGPYQYAAAPTNPVIIVSPTTLNFGSVPMSSSNALSFTVQNTGGGILSGTASVAGSFFSIVDSGTYSLGAGQSQVVRISYRPTTTGTNTASVTFTGGGGAVATVSGSARALSAINLSPANPGILTGVSQQFSAIGTYSDGTTQDLTSMVVWNSSVTPVATLSAAGLATGVSAGTTTISATFAGVSGSTVLTVQTAPLAVTTTSLANTTINMPYTATLTAGGGTGPYSWSIVSGWLPLGLTLNSSSGLIAGTPTASGTFSITAQVSDAANPARTANKVLSIVVSSVATIWASSATPSLADEGSSSTNAVELGVKFRSDAAGTITGIRFYKAAANTGTHVGNLWSTNGTLLASATFANETASGWQQVLFAAPVTISSNTVYVASYRTTNGHYSEDDNYFASNGVDNPPLHALADGVSGGNGTYVYGSTSTFPNQTWSSANYWVDVVFRPATSPAVQRPLAPTSLHVVSGN